MLSQPTETLVYSLYFLVAMLVAVIIFLPRLLKRKAPDLQLRNETDMIAESFSMLGNELKSLREQLITKERLATLGEVSAGIAHELRNPMAVIMGYSKLLLKDLDEKDGRRETVQAIINEIDTMNRVMEELLRFSKSEPISKSDVDLTRMTESAVSETARPGSVLVVSAGRLVVRGDETLLKQAVKNLVNNALDAGDSVRVDLREVEAGGKRGAIVEVSDNGKGMSREELKKIFSPFYSTKESGLGIGLSLVQKIALAHGAPVEVSSKEGKGSTFRLFLPY
jgi:signal transduction histidine kinase